MQNPFIEALRQGSSAYEASLGNAETLISGANSAFATAGSLALKLDALLQEEEAKRFREKIQTERLLLAKQQYDLQKQNFDFNKNISEQDLALKGARLNRDLAQDEYQKLKDDKTLKINALNAELSSISSQTSAIYKDLNKKISEWQSLASVVPNPEIASPELKTEIENDKAMLNKLLSKQNEITNQLKSISGIGSKKEQMAQSLSTLNTDASTLQQYGIKHKSASIEPSLANIGTSASAENGNELQKTINVASGIVTTILNAPDNKLPVVANQVFNRPDLQAPVAYAALKAMDNGDEQFLKKVISSLDRVYDKGMLRGEVQIEIGGKKKTVSWPQFRKQIKTYVDVKQKIDSINLQPASIEAIQEVTGKPWQEVKYNLLRNVPKLSATLGSENIANHIESFLKSVSDKKGKLLDTPITDMLFGLFSTGPINVEAFSVDRLDYDAIKDMAKRYIPKDLYEKDIKRLDDIIRRYRTNRLGQKGMNAAQRFSAKRNKKQISPADYEDVVNAMKPIVKHLYEGMVNSNVPKTVVMTKNYDKLNDGEKFFVGLLALRAAWEGGESWDQ